MQISAGFNTTISTVCSGGTNTGDRCRTAGEAIGNACFASVQLGNNATCTGACGGQLATAAAACATSVSCKIAVYLLWSCYVATCSIMMEE